MKIADLVLTLTSIRVPLIEGKNKPLEFYNKVADLLAVLISWKSS